jgi:hypothetical protein
MSTEDYDPNQFMAMERRVDPPVNFVPPEWPQYHPQQGPGYMLPNMQGMAQAAAQGAMLQGMAYASQGIAQTMQGANAALANMQPPQLFAGGGGSHAASAKGIVDWLKSGRYDFPHGKDIDFFHNRLCFDKPCKHDPEMTNSISTEWLRRSTPIAQYKPAPPKPQPMLKIVHKPDQRYSLIPYQNVSKGKVVCASRVRLPNGLPLRFSRVPTEDILRGFDIKTSVGEPLHLVAIDRFRTINSFL